MTPDDVLAFWFAELRPAQRFKSDPALDEEIMRRFAGIHYALELTVPDAWRSTARGALAAVIVLDQFPRNMFRGTDPRPRTNLSS